VLSCFEGESIKKTHIFDEECVTWFSSGSIQKVIEDVEWNKKRGLCSVLLHACMHACACMK